MRHRLFGLAGRGRLVAVPGTVIVWHGLGGWMAALEDLSNRARPCEAHYARSDALYRSLSLDDVRRCRDADALDRAITLFGLLRSAWGCPLLTRPPRDLGRGHFASLQIEAHNQRHRLALGRLDGPRARGPRFDARRIPDARLLALLQRPIDPTRREALEAERRRRGL